MQTPTGYAINASGQFVMKGSRLDVIFNPSFPYRVVHTVTVVYPTTAFVVGGAGAWHLLRRRRAPDGASPEAARIMFSMAMWMAAIVAPIQIFAGDEHGLNPLAHQPAKIMAMEGHFQSHPNGAPLILLGIPNQAKQRIDYAVEIPKPSSVILKRDADAPLAGLDTIPRDKQPPVVIVFWSFRVMVGLGMAMLGLGLWSLLARARGKLFDRPWLHRAGVVMAPSGFVALIAGWITTEVSRQPYTVYGLLLTAKSESPLAAPAVGASLVAFVVVYFAVLGIGTWYILKLMTDGVYPQEGGLDESGPLTRAGVAASIMGVRDPVAAE